MSFLAARGSTIVPLLVGAAGARKTKIMKKSRFSSFGFPFLVAAALVLCAPGMAPLVAQNPNGLILTDQWLALGPFLLPTNFDCDQTDDALLKDYIAPSSIERMAPAEADEVEYDPDQTEEATIGYAGPVGPGGNPVWRPFDDGVDGDFFADEDLDMDRDAINADSTTTDYIMTHVVTYFTYSGDEPIAVETCVGSDDSVQVWIDTELVLNNNDCRGRGQCQDNVPVIVAPGLHRIVMIVFEQGGSFGGSFGFTKDGQFITDSDPDWSFLGTDPSGLVFPEAKFSVDLSSGAEPLTVQFDGSASTTPSGALTRYEWEFGDGEQAEGVKVTHVYQKASFHAPRLTVTNSTQGTDSTRQTIAVTLPPQDVAPWASADVGKPVLPGGERRQGSCIAVFAGGSGVSDTADQFHFTYLEKGGADYVLTAQVDEALWRPGAIAGIMVRETLDPESRFAFAYAQYLIGVGGVQYGLLSRKTQGAKALASRGNVVAFPPKGFLRLERKGNELSASSSPDGAAWTLLYTTIFNGMSESAFVGLAVAGGDGEASRQAARITFCDLDFGPLGGIFLRGDPDDNGERQLTDAVRILNYLFLGLGGIPCLDAADADDSGDIQLTDAVRILNFLFQGTGVIPPPYLECGPDETPDGAVELGCESYTNC